MQHSSVRRTMNDLIIGLMIDFICLTIERATNEISVLLILTCELGKDHQICPRQSHISYSLLIYHAFP